MKIISLVVTLWKLVARYPALSAGLFNIIIVAGAQVGLTLTTAQLTGLASAVAAIFGVLVTAGVIPVTKVANVKAGLRPTVPVGVSVASVEGNAKPVVVAPAPVPAPEPTVVATPVVEADVDQPESRRADVPVAADPVPVEIVPDAITTIEAKPASDASRLGKPIVPFVKGK